MEQIDKLETLLCQREDGIRELRSKIAALEAAVKEKDGLLTIYKKDMAEIAHINSELYEQIAALTAETPPEREQGEGACKEEDGCPTEGAVLRREWRRLTAENKQRAKVIARYREALERISRYDSYHQEWPNDIYINAPPEELATFVLAGDNYPPDALKEEMKGCLIKN